MLSAQQSQINRSSYLPAVIAAAVLLIGAFAADQAYAETLHKQGVQAEKIAR
jgi:sensor domain CHASE-containing protein